MDIFTQWFDVGVLNNAITGGTIKVFAAPAEEVGEHPASGAHAA